MNRRTLFKSFLVAPAVAMAKPAPEFTSGHAIMRASREDESAEVINLAFIRLGLIAPGERLSEPDYRMGRKFYRAGMDDADMARVLAPYYPQTPVGKYEGQFAWNPPTNCLKCGNAVYYLPPQLPYSANLIRCSAPACENNWPWLQNGMTTGRVSVKVKGLIEDVDRAVFILQDAERQYRNRATETARIWDPIAQCDAKDAIESLRYMTNRKQAALQELIYAEVIKCL